MTKFSMDTLPPAHPSQTPPEKREPIPGVDWPFREIFSTPQERGFYDKDFDHFNDDKGQ